MLGYYEGMGNVARPVNGEYKELECLGCGNPQTHHKESDGWRCVVCDTTQVIWEVKP